MLQSWALVSNYCVYSAMAIYAIAFIAHAIETAWALKAPVTSPKILISQTVQGSWDQDSSVKALTTLDYKRTEKIARIATALMVLGFVLLFVGVIARGVSAERVPWGNMYEFSITGALAFSGAYLLALRKYDLRWLGLLVSFSVLLALGTAVTVLYVPSAPLVPALKSPWLVIHVATAIISGGVFLLSNIIASAYLYLDRMESKGERSAWCDLCRECMGSLLGLGSKRDLGLYYVGCICGLLTRPCDRWMARPTRGMVMPICGLDVLI